MKAIEVFANMMLSKDTVVLGLYESREIQVIGKIKGISLANENPDLFVDVLADNGEFYKNIYVKKG